MIDLRRLRVLRSVAHYGTITAAAEAMHFTPSAASAQIRQLSRELDVQLLEPHGRGVRLTVAARRLLAHADEIAAQWERAEIDLHADGDQPSGPLRLAGFPVAVSTLLAPLAARLRTLHPRLNVQIRETEPKPSLDLLFDGEVDLAIIEATTSIPPSGDKRFDQRPLLDDPLDLVVPDGHRFAGREQIDLAEAAAEDWVVQPWAMTGNTCREFTLTACAAAGFVPKIVHQAVEWNAIANLIAHDLGITLFPRLAHLPPHLPLTRVGVTDQPRRKLLTCTRGGGRDRPAVAAALRELHEAAPDAVRRQ